VIPAFDPATGALPPGDHRATLEEIGRRFGFTPRRRWLLMIASIRIGSISRWFWSRKFGSGSGGCGPITAWSFSFIPLCGQDLRSGFQSFSDRIETVCPEA
jgi:hypothetical protein